MKQDERNNHFDFDFTPLGQSNQKARKAHIQMTFLFSHNQHLRFLISSYTEVLKYSNMQDLFVNVVIVLLENIKYYLFYLCISP